ncbi:hypothetical protein GCM10014719_65270 [Planomonospora parontospora subsp. antibiotica]|nr:hypothetical protein GCM10014719_65270 [Planomonospora parontospora subsp. antibiotica]GII19290.1 hypothetical protein Ppa05_60160 [Planomonospora parontospora subsp. antibiotica]
MIHLPAFVWGRLLRGRGRANGQPPRNGEVIPSQMGRGTDQAINALLRHLSPAHYEVTRRRFLSLGLSSGSATHTAPRQQ